MNLQRKVEIINRVLDKEIKNLHGAKRSFLYDELLKCQFSSIKVCFNQASKILGLKKSLTSRSIEYWSIRGWDEFTARHKAKEISKTMPSNSPYSVTHWTNKINPATNQNYTIDEAKFECNSRRPIKMEYWLVLGHTKDEAERLAKDHKNNNDRKAALASSNRSSELKKLSSNKTVEYWVMRGFSRDEAVKKISELQATFTYEKCISKYGAIEGKKRWGQRQKKWITALNSCGMKGGFSKISNELFTLLSANFPSILYGTNEKILTIDENVYMIDCIHIEKKKIIEFYGDYWHANPKKFNSSKKVHKKIAKDIWTKDNKKIEDLQALGYEILVIWESEYKANKEETISKCIQFLNS